VRAAVQEAAAVTKAREVEAKAVEVPTAAEAVAMVATEAAAAE